MSWRCGCSLLATVATVARRGEAGAATVAGLNASAGFRGICGNRAGPGNSGAEGSRGGALPLPLALLLLLPPLLRLRCGR